MDDLSAAHLDWMGRQNHRSPNTVASRRRVLRSVGNAGTATRDDLQAWWDARAHLADGTRNVDLAHLREFYKWAQKRDLRVDDPSVLLEAPRVGNVIHRKVSDDKIVELIAALPPDLARAVRLGAFAGLRVAESAGLDWADVDTSEDMLYVRGKGGKMRTVEVSPELLQQLRTDDETPRGNIVTAGGTPYTPAALQRKLNRHMRDHGAEFTSHDLRHRWGITAYRVNGDLLAVSEMMGHSSVNTTKIYAQAASASRRKIASAVML